MAQKNEKLIENSKKSDTEYENCCRICLNEQKEMYDLFCFRISTNKTLVVEFIRRITGLDLAEINTMPNNICSLCSEKTVDIHNFIQLCIESDKILRNSETRRLLRKIEEEALTEYSKLEDDYYEERPADFVPELPKEESANQMQSTHENKFASAKYSCSICLTSFTNKAKFQRHKTSHDESSYKCDKCGQGFTKEKHLVVHLRSHLKKEEKKYVCKTCGAHFAFAYLLKQHEYKHSDQKPFPCTKCDKGCLTAESLRRHMTIHDENYVKKSCACIICNKEFAYPSFLAEHMKNHTGERPHLCSVCGKGFRQSGALHFHQRIHTGSKPFKCKFCEEHFRSMSKLNAHIRTHTNERPFICDICGIGFKQSGDLKSHKMRHDGQKQVLCTVCGKKVSSTGQLMVHLRTHTGEKPYSCETCKNSFTTRALLNKHNRTHTGEKPYVCDVCGKSFSQSSSLKAHSKVHLKDNVKKGSVKKKKSESKSDVENKDTTTITVILPAPIPLIQNE